MPDLRISFALIILSASVLFSQNPGQLFELYDQHKTEQIRQLLASTPGDQPELRFFRYLFIENGDEAVRLYEALYPEASGRTKKMVARKIGEYYYAKGFYVKADEYFSRADLPVEEQTPAAPAKKLYYIQVGAFGYNDNAVRMKNLLQERGVSATVEQREINGKTLFCVWIAGTEDQDQTRQLAEDLKQKHKLNYQIINP